MNADFADAHERHWHDAGQLFGAGRWANADHLYGLACECGLKCLMVAFGMGTRVSDGAPSRDDDRVHVERAWDRYETYRSGHSQGAGYTLSPGNPFSNWHASQRYAAQCCFDESRVMPHKVGADAVHQLISQATIAGLMP